MYANVVEMTPIPALSSVVIVNMYFGSGSFAPEMAAVAFSVD